MAAKDETLAGLYRLPLAARRAAIANASASALNEPFASGDDAWTNSQLTLQDADAMVENCIGMLSVPLGVAPTFVVNGVSRIVPMATEEPSVVAAAAAGAKTICASSRAAGFAADVSSRPIVYAQLQIAEVVTPVIPTETTHTPHITLSEPSHTRLERARAVLYSNADAIQACANTHCDSMVRRGGGCIGITTRLVRVQNPNSFSRNDAEDSVHGNGVTSDAVASRQHRPLVFADDYCARDATGNTVRSTRSITQITRKARESMGDVAGWLVLMLRLDVCDSMGANCCSTVAEGITPFINSLVAEMGLRVRIRIVSNYCVERMARAWFRIPTSQLAYKGVDGHVLAQRIVDANEWAKADVFRAATHNKGIMNGIDAVAVATGQDWRALEASAHTHASMLHSTRYHQQSEPDVASSNSNPDEACRWEQSPVGVSALTEYSIETFDEIPDTPFLVGFLEIPLAVGTRGGAVQSGGEYRRNLAIMGNPTSSELAEVLVSVGLAQNFAALRALVTEGIQSGHMRLHQRRLDAALTASPSNAGK